MVIWWGGNQKLRRGGGGGGGGGANVIDLRPELALIPMTLSSALALFSFVAE